MNPPVRRELEPMESLRSPMSTSDGSPAAPHDLAAGGIVERIVAGRVEIALVARRRHGVDGRGDLALPKGHLDAGETWPEAALREVAEETGCRCEIAGPPVPTSYMAGDTPKLVVFFPMRCLEEGAIRDGSEVREVSWLGPAAALRCASYPSERELLRTLYYPSRTSERLDRILESWRRPTAGAWYERFRAAAWELRYQLESTGEVSPTPAWQRSAKDCLEEAERLAARGENSVAWKLLKHARRLALSRLESSARLRAVHADRLLAESTEKLRSWRKEAIAKVLATADPHVPSVEQLIAAQALLDEHVDDAYRELAASLRRLMLVPWILLAALALLWSKTVFVPDSIAAGEAATALSSPARLATAMLMGGFGVLFSFAFGGRARAKRVRGELSRGGELFLRLTLGAASAVAATVAVEAGGIDFVRIDGPRIFLVALAAVLADRFLMRVLSRIDAGAGK